MINILGHQKACQYYKNFYFQILFYEISVCFLLRKNKGNLDNKNYPDVLTLFLLKSDSYLQKKFVLLLDWKSFKNDEKWFLFHLKSSFHSQDIYVFVTTFWSCKKSSLIRKIRLTSKFMTSQPGLQTIAIHILPNISQGKGNQTMKFGRLTECNKVIIFLPKLCSKWAKKTSFRPLFIF